MNKSYSLITLASLALNPACRGEGVDSSSLDAASNMSDADPLAPDASHARFNDVVADGKLDANIFAIDADYGRVVLAEAGCSDGCVATIDSSDRAAPSRIGSFSTPYLDEDALSVQLLDGGRAAVGTNFGLFVLGLDGLPTITEIASSTTDGEASDIAVAGSTIVVAQRNFGVYFYDSSSLSLEGDWSPGGNPDLRSIAVDGDRAFAGGFSSGAIHGVDIGTPSAPVEASQTSTDDRVWAIAARAGRIYVAAGTEGLLIYDRDLKLLGSYDGGDLGEHGYTDLSLLESGQILLANSASGLEMVDATTPSAVSQVASVEMEKKAFRVVASGSKVYASNDTDGGLHLFHLE